MFSRKRSRRRHWRLAPWHFVAVLLGILLVPWGWHHRHDAWMHPFSPAAGPDGGVHIQFDNGTVRQMPSASEAEAAAAGLAPFRAPGGVRKCRKGATTVYTDGPCPPGSHEADLARGTVNVVSGGAAAASPASPPAKQATGPGPASSASHKSLLEMMVPDNGLRDKVMQRMGNP